MNKDTVSMHFVDAAMQRLDPSARVRVLAAVEIAPEMISNSNARLTADSFSKLWQTIALELDDEFFGLGQRCMRRGSFALLCQAAHHCKTLEKAIKRYIRSFSLFIDELTAELSFEGRTASIRLHNSILNPEDRLFADETWLVMVYALMCTLVRQRIPIKRLYLAHPRPAHWHEYSSMFTRSLSFNTTATQLDFDARFLHAPIVQTDSGLRNFLRNAPRSVFLKFKNDDGWTSQIRRRLRQAAGHEWPTFPQLANEYFVSRATLRRRLASEGSSFQDIKNDLRRDEAIHLLCNSQMTVSQIAERLGFQEPSAFHRAFKKWCGAQPGEFRHQVHGSNDT